MLKAKAKQHGLKISELAHAIMDNRAHTEHASTRCTASKGLIPAAPTSPSTKHAK